MFEYYPGNSLLHRLDIRTKSLGFLMLTLFSFIFQTPLINLLLVILSLLLAFSSGLTVNKIANKLKPLIVVFILIIIMTGFSYSPEFFSIESSRQIIFSMTSSIHFTSGGLQFGFTLFFRMIIMVVTSSVLIFTTALNDFFQMMQKLSVPYQLAFVLTTAIRFIPTLEQKAETIMDAQKARGSNIGTGKFFVRIRTYIPVMIPLITEAMRMSENLAAGMLNRGFGARKQTTTIDEIKMRSVDHLFIVIIVALMTFGILLRFRGFGTL